MKPKPTNVATDGASCPLPSFAPPVSVPLHVFPEQSCPYLPGRASLVRGVFAADFPGDLYHGFLDANFRRSGRLVYQPICSRCRECRTLRVRVDRFAPSKTQRRVWRRNLDLRVTESLPSLTDEKFALYQRYVRDWHGRDEQTTREELFRFLYDSPVNTIEFEHRDEAGKLVAVSIADVCSRSLSSVYVFFDPAESRRSPGTFTALHDIEWARMRGIPFYYLGYFVEGCGAMEYKAAFRPCEVLDADGVWREPSR